MTYTAIRAFSFLTAFTIGLFFVSGVQAFSELPDGAATSKSTDVRPNSTLSPVDKGFVEIRYLGSETKNNNEVLRFVAHNAGDTDAVYMSYPDSGLDGLQFKIDGTKRPLFLCGTGMEEQVLRPGAKIEFTISRSFIDHLQKDGGKILNVGHYFKKADTAEYVEVWSEDVFLG
ncbi:MAG: hypothetical protein DWQ47_03895 [Acidobacteria bacterium]|nr:MAG: hypothetical protein DWQ32_07445 [Acidobacteriota bacterium]REK01537.1 MAG: hypothetical protein DWQ38_03880 [Acidobacteriota bacterium]REK14493.1 MAG: hypothetical protein DWQ43_13135 [Acidobacteriota bacterium]REK45208.1 MAG: hypothetical protein DWQ47_03895 [Acidobacteriota bacterium]